jgi:hypothetical protein
MHSNTAPIWSAILAIAGWNDQPLAPYSEWLSYSCTVQPVPRVAALVPELCHV